MNFIIEVQHFRSFRLIQLRNGNTRPAADDSRDFFFRNLVMHKAVLLFLLRNTLRLRKFLLYLWQVLILQLRSLLILALLHGNIDLRL